MAEPPSQRRRVRCPKCPTILLEPPGVEVYKCPECSTFLQAKGTSFNSQEKALPGPSNENDGPTTTGHEGCSSINHEIQRENQLNNDETEEPMPGNRSIKQQEQLLGTGKTEMVLVLETRKEEDPQRQGSSSPTVSNINTTIPASTAFVAIGEEDMVIRVQNFLNHPSRDVVSAGKEGELSNEAEVSKDQLMPQDNPSKRDDKDAGECVSVDETHEGEGNIANYKHDANFESEIIRDTSCELSFKYIASNLKSNVRRAQKRRIHRLAKLSSEVSGGEDEVTTTPDLSLILPSSENDSSDDYERYSSLSESASNDDSNAEFDFPAPSADSMGSAKLSDVFVQPKKPEGPHQLEWQDADYDNGISTFPGLNSSTISSVGVVGKVEMEQGDKEEILEDRPYVKGLLKIVVPRGLDDSLTSSKSSRLQRENGFSGIEGLANKEGQMSSERKEGSLVSSPNDDKLKLSIELKDKPLESSGVLSLIKSVASSALEDSSTANLRYNAPDIVEEGNKRLEKPVARAIAATRGDYENAHSGLRKELGSAGVQSALVVEHINLSNNGANNTLQSEGHHQQDLFCEEVQVHNRVDIMKMLEAKRHHKRNYSSDEAHLLNGKDVSSSSNTYQDRRKIHDEDLYMSRTVEGSFCTHQGHVQAAPMLAGPSFQLQNPQADLHFVRQTTQPFGSNFYYDGSRSFANTVSYQAPFHPWMLPVAMPGHGCNHHGCHSVGPVCMPYVHSQHSHVPMPSCLLCVRTMGHHQEVGNYYQGCQVPAPCMLCHSPTCFSTQTAHMHDTSMAATEPLVLSVRKPKHYPPLPQGRMAPYVACRSCKDILEVPVSLPPSDGRAQKLRCGGCGKVSKFSVLNSSEKSHILGLESPAVGSTRKASTSSLPSFEFMVRRTEVTGANVGHSLESSYGQSLHPRNQRGSISSRHYTSSGVSHAVSNRDLHHSSQGETTSKIKPGQDEPDTMVSSTTSNHNSQDEFFFRVLSRKSEMDSSRRLFRGFKTMTSRFGVDIAGDDGMIGSNDVPLQCTIDEKEEGLDFGAPRPSDGESLDQRSPESRMRSSEIFELEDQPRHRRRSFGDEDTCWTTEIQQEFRSKRNDTAQERRPGTSLFALLNQESIKFKIPLPERVSYEEPLSPASNSPVRDPTNQMSSSGKEIRRPRKLRGEHFGKGARYLAAMLTRSLKHHVND